MSSSKRSWRVHSDLPPRTLAQSSSRMRLAKFLVISTIMSASSGYLNAGVTQTLSPKLASNSRSSTSTSSLSPPLSQLLKPITSSATVNTNPPPTASEYPTRAPTTQPDTEAPATTERPNSWIESILIRVESLNLNGEKNLFNFGKRLLQDHDDDVDLADDGSNMTKVPASVEAPTDSEEDSLETAPTTVLSTSPNSLQNSVITVAAEDEQQLVESNNVSAILAAPVTLDESSNDATLRLPLPAEVTTAAPITTAVAPLTASTKTPLTCDQAYTQCALRKVCAPALKAYNDDCQELINNKTSVCSPKCLKAMIALRSSEEGDDLVDCDCQGNEYCLQSKQRSLACGPQVEEAIDPKTVVPCMTASWICLADQLCSTALEYYYRNCQLSFSQRLCSSRCNNSLAIVYRQAKAAKLITCQCDGTEDFPCVRYKTYTEKLCLNKQPTQLQIQLPLDSTNSAASFDEISSSPDNEADADHQLARDNDGEEHEEDNLTNEQADIMLPMASSGESAEDDSDPEVVTSGDASGGGTHNESPSENSSHSSGSSQEDSWSANSNGIQSTSPSSSIEDNWIPVMSGRYFTNLQFQQRVKQHLQRRRQEQQDQEGRAIEESRDNSRRGGKQQPPKSGKSTSGRGSYNRNHKRNRQSRILVLASSAPSSASSIVAYGFQVPEMLVNLLIVAVIAVVTKSRAQIGCLI